MRILPGSRGVALCLLLVSVLCSAALSLGREVEVVGYAESSKIMNPQTFSGLRVTIECKTADAKGHFVTRGNGEIDEKGKFSLNIPHDIVGDDGTLKEACYAQLHSASGNPCPAHDGLEASKIMFLSKSGDKHVFGLKQNLKFSPEVCISKLFWHMPKFPLPPPLKKPCPPKIKLPPVVIPKKPYPPKIVHKPSVPIYKPPVVIPKKPCPPKSVHKPSVPIYKPPKKVLPPIYKPPVVVIPKKPCPPKVSVPIYKPPVVVIPKKPCPPLPKLPPVVVIPKKPCPPLPPFPKFPKFPPTYIPHPKFGKWPPFPSHP
ncbi:unnamed protein product [Arabis nemorensis]|uniref:Uncharacterized protein n=1 Tax=Arabis nemorensis TaxID=586526 RepID=A0A565C4G5_9BRAS|nr:unnamed protein product [Arabis nemorensis]